MSAIGQFPPAALGGKPLVIVGGQSGIGARTAELAAEQGATVAVAGRRRAEGEAVVARLSRAGQYLPVDVRDEHQIATLIGRVADEYGRIDAIVNCAGDSGSLSGIADVDLAGLDAAEADRTAGQLEPTFLQALERWQLLRHAGTPDDVAPAIVWLAGDASGFVNGHDLVVDGGISAGRPQSNSIADRAKIANVLIP